MKRRTAVVSLIAIGLVGSAFLAIPASSRSSSEGPLVAYPTGQNEVPEADRRGRGGFTAIVQLGGNQFCYGLAVKNLDQPIAAHIHRGSAGENGPVVITLTPPATGDPGTSSACVTVERNLLERVLLRPHNFYVNVHTQRFPGGAIRDQLTRFSG